MNIYLSLPYGYVLKTIGLLVNYRLGQWEKNMFKYVYEFCEEPPSCLLCETMFWGLESRKVTDYYYFDIMYCFVEFEVVV